MEFVSKITQLSSSKPIVLHIDFIGLYRVGDTNEERLKNFSNLMEILGKNSQPIAIPSFSYSYTDNQVFDIKNSPSKTGYVTEYLRKNSAAKRTIDGIFSYLTYSDLFDSRHYEVDDYESFGKNGIAGEIFSKDGWIGAIGGVFRHATEIHFLERLLGVSYRFDKYFSGQTIDEKGESRQNDIKYFCRKDMNIRPDFRNFEADLKKEGLMQTWQFEAPEIEIEAVKIRDAFELLKTKIAKDEHYLCIEVDKWVP
jgi:aminoglycoside 3-N-acetyltransferase